MYWCVLHFYSCDVQHFCVSVSNLCIELQLHKYSWTVTMGKQKENMYCNEKDSNNNKLCFFCVNKISLFVTL